VNVNQCITGSITICTDCRKIINYVTREQLKASKFTQDAGATLEAIKKAIDEVTVNILL